jgi:hypothetical protein
MRRGHTLVCWHAPRAQLHEQPTHALALRPARPHTHTPTQTQPPPDGDVLAPHRRPVHDLILCYRLALVVRAAAGACGAGASERACVRRQAAGGGVVASVSLAVGWMASAPRHPCQARPTPRPPRPLTPTRTGHTHAQDTHTRARTHTGDTHTRAHAHTRTRAPVVSRRRISTSMCLSLMRTSRK